MNQKISKNRRILIIDDNEAIHKDFRAILEGNDRNFNVDEEKNAIFGTALRSLDRSFEIDSAFHGQEGLLKVQQAVRQNQPYAMVFVDVRMPPGWDGIETAQEIWREDPNIQIVICTAYSDYSWREMVSKLGETDQLLILKKPFDNIEVRQIACSLAEKWNILNNLEYLVKERTAEVLEVRDLTVFALAKLAESRDPEIGGHVERIRTYSQILAEYLQKEGPYQKQINEQFLNNIYRASPIHDIGKVGIPDTILLKPGQLNDEEFEIMKRHTLIGEDAIKTIAKYGKSGDFLTMAIEVTRSHHERFDGRGYPDGLIGLDIPLSARIVALADVFDAITSARVYKSASEPIIARSMIENETGKHFDPAIVDAFCDCWDDFLKIAKLADQSISGMMEPIISHDLQR
ncbi:MAG TPA: HD domain-containing protein [Sedimentisphaerales bacterium]|nr:HD domain-containing protein [Sedimentisphaerales bacterium]